MERLLRVGDLAQDAITRDLITGLYSKLVSNSELAGEDRLGLTIASDFNHCVAGLFETYLSILGKLFLPTRTTHTTTLKDADRDDPHD